MKMFALVLLCSLVCAGCARQMTTLSDGQPGYRVTCETLRQRCLDDIALICRDKGYAIVTERADEWRLPLIWVDNGGLVGFNSRYWMEVRCLP